MSQIAVLGTGHMGAPIVRRLLATGHQVTVWNRTAARAEELSTTGAVVAPTPKAAVAEADVVITMLTDGSAVEAVLFGPDGAAGALRSGATVVDMSTIGPVAVRALVARLPAGIDLVDAPVGGGPAAAEAGELTILTGGSVAAVERVEPVLNALGTVRHFGGTGSGAAVKLVLNTALATGITALADALAVARAVGVDRDTALEVLAGSAIGGAVRRATATGVHFALSLAAKDIDLALATLDPADAKVARAAAGVLRDAADPTADIATVIQNPRPAQEST